MCCFMSFPLCYVFQFLKTPKVRLWYAIIIGVSINFTCYRKNIIHFLIQMIVTKSALHLGERFKVLNIAYYIFVYNMIHCSCVHVYIRGKVVSSLRRLCRTQHHDFRTRRKLLRLVWSSALFTELLLMKRVNNEKN